MDESLLRTIPGHATRYDPATVSHVTPIHGWYQFDEFETVSFPVRNFVRQLRGLPPLPAETRRREDRGWMVKPHVVVGFCGRERDFSYHNDEAMQKACEEILAEVERAKAERAKARMSA